MSEKVAIVQYRRPAGPGEALGPGRIVVVEDRFPGAQVGLERDWIVVSSMYGNLAFYPRESVIRARNEPAGGS